MAPRTPSRPLSSPELPVFLIGLDPSGTPTFVAVDDDGNLSVNVSIGDLINIGLNGVALDGDAGNASAQTLRVAVATDDVNLAAVKAAVQVMDDWDESDRAKVNPIAGQVGVAGGTGADGPTVQRVSLATDVPLPAGTNAIGKLAANNGVDIGDVDVKSLPVGAQAMAASTPVTIASNDTLTTAIKTAVEVMDDWDESDRAKVNLIAGQAGVAAGAGASGVNTVRTIESSDGPVARVFGAILLSDAQQLAFNVAGGADAKVELTAGAQYRLVATEDIRFGFGATGDTAAATSALLHKKQQESVAVPAAPNNFLHVIGDAAAAGDLSIQKMS